MTHNEMLQIIRAMRTRGGAFVQRLGDLWLYADDENCKRIETAWPEYIAFYRDVAAGLADIEERHRRQAEILRRNGT